MYFIPFGLLVKHDSGFVGSLTGPPDLTHLTWTGFLVHNLVPVTLGNIAGGGLMVGALYWFVYLRSHSDVAAAQTSRDAPATPGLRSTG
jgi:formate transporter